MSDEPELTAGQRKMQQLLAELAATIDVMNDVAIENHIDSVDFMGTRIVFGTNWDKDSWAKDWMSRNHIQPGFAPLADGPAITDIFWSASHFSCWPSEEASKLVFGTDKSKWPKSSYVDDDY